MEAKLSKVWDESVSLSKLSPEYSVSVGDGLRIMLSLLNVTDQSSSDHGKRYVLSNSKRLETRLYGLSYDEEGNAYEGEMPIDEESGERMSELLRGKPYTLELEDNKQRYFTNTLESIEEFIHNTLMGDVQAEGNLYYTPNIFNYFSGSRLESNVSHLTCIFIDIDNVTPDEAQARLVNSGLPTPTLGISSGGGVHYYWIFNYNVPSNGVKSRRAKELGYTYLDTWRNLTKYYQYKLGGDPKVSDACRLLRIPGSVNYKGEDPVKTYFLFCDPSNTHNILELNKQYLEERATLVEDVNNGRIQFSDLYKPFRYLVDSSIREDGKKLTNTIEDLNTNNTKSESKSFNVSNNNVRYGFANYHHLVIQDLIKLSELRGGISQGNRNDYLTLLSQFGMSPQELHSANRNYIKASDRYSTKQVDHIINRKHSYTREGVKPKRETMIDWLDITIDEQSQLKVVVSEPLANIRKSIKSIDELSSKVINSYGMMLKRVISNHVKGKKWTVKYKANLLSLTTRGVYRLQKGEVRTLAQEQEEQERIVSLVKSSLDLIDEVLNTLFVLMELGLPKAECNEFQNRLDNQTKQLKRLNNLLGGESIFHKSKVRVKQVEARVIELQDYMNTIAA